MINLGSLGSVLGAATGSGNTRNSGMSGMLMTMLGSMVTSRALGNVMKNMGQDKVGKVATTLGGSDMTPEKLLEAFKGMSEEDQDKVAEQLKKIEDDNEPDTLEGSADKLKGMLGLGL